MTFLIQYPVIQQLQLSGIYFPIRKKESIEFISLIKESMGLKA